MLVYTRVQLDVYAHLPTHDLVPCSSKDLQLPSWVMDWQTQPRRRPLPVSTVLLGQSGAPAAAGGRKVHAMSTRQAAQAAEARRRQDCTYDASPPTDGRQPLLTRR